MTDAQQQKKRRKMEASQIRRLLWRAVIELLKTTHKHRFPGRRFGSDCGLLLFYGASVVMYLEGRKVRASSVARYLHMPNETARRYLGQLEELGLLEREDHSMRPSAKTAQAFDLEKPLHFLREAARLL